jgi:splicing factor 3A subunit 1
MHRFVMTVPENAAAVAHEKLQLRNRILTGAPEEEQAGEDGNGTTAASGSTPASRAPVRKLGLLDTVAQKLKVTEATQPPPENRKSWALDVPALAAADLDIIKLTAQYVARNGRSFQMGLMNREARNPQFAFLQPGHPYNPFYNKLVESYTAVLLPSREMLEQLKALRIDKEGLVRRVVSRALTQRVLVKTEAQRQAAEEAERDAMSQIDWSDFVVVQTLSFADSENLPPPPDKQRIIAGTMGAHEAASEAADAMEVEPSQPIATSSVVDTGAGMFSSEDLSGAPTRVVSAGVASSSRRNTSALKTMVCPKCGQAIPVDEFAEHMKIELSGAGTILHGQAGSGRRLEMNRGPGIDNPYEEGDMISLNLQRLAAKRTDIFGAEEDEMEALAKKNAEEERLRKLRESKSWDGHATSAGSLTAATTTSGVYDQIAAIHQAKGLGPSRAPHGPQEHPAPGSMPPHMMMNRPPPGMMMGPRPGMQGPPMQYGGPPPMMMMPPYGGHMGPGYPPMPMMSGGYTGPGYPPQQMQPPDNGGMKRAAEAPLEEEPPAKRAKVEPETALIDENEFLTKMGGPEFKVKVRVSNQSAGGDAPAQEIEIELALGQPVSALKSEIQQRLGIAPNKQNLRSASLGIFLKDKQTLAYHNIDDNHQVILLPKERGGKKK